MKPTVEDLLRFLINADEIVSGDSPEITLEKLRQLTDSLPEPVAIAFILHLEIEIFKSFQCDESWPRFFSLIPLQHQPEALHLLVKELINDWRYEPWIYRACVLATKNNWPLPPHWLKNLRWLVELNRDNDSLTSQKARLWLESYDKTKVTST